MDILQIGIILGILAFFAHIVKGITGFGPAIIFVSLGSLIYNPIEIIVLAALLDIIGGGYLSLRNLHFFENKKYWVPMGLSMVIGAIIGSLTLYIIPSTLFEYILGFVIIIISFWFLFGNFEPGVDSNNPNDITLLDGGVGIFSGFSGGFTGMGGPPLIIYLGAKYKKELFRAIIVPIFLVSAIARFSTYGFIGMVNINNIWIYIIPSIGVIFGNYIGNKLFDNFEQKWFTILIGIILIISGIQLIY